MSSDLELPPTHGHHVFRRSAEQLLMMLEEFKGEHVLPRLYEDDSPISDDDIMTVRRNLDDVEKLISRSYSPKDQDKYLFGLHRILTLSYYVALKHSGRRKGKKAAKGQSKVIDKEKKKNIVEEVARSFLERNPKKFGHWSSVAAAILNDVNLRIVAEHEAGRISASKIEHKATFDYLKEIFPLNHQRP